MANPNAFDVACLGEVFHYDEMYRLVQVVQDRPHVLHAPPDKNMTIHKVDILGMGDCNSECSIVLGRFLCLEQPDYNDENLKRILTITYLHKQWAIMSHGIRP